MRHLLSALFPSWAFFIEPGPAIRLEYFDGTAWHNAIPPIRRSWKRVFVHSEAGFLHAAHNGVDHLLTTCANLTSADAATIEALPDYKIIERLVRETAPTCRRFRILSEQELVFQSPELS